MNKIPLKKKLALELYRKYRDNHKKLHELKYILWESTLRCNLNCIHCGSDCKKDAYVPDMPKDDFLKAIDNIAPNVDRHKTFIVITGGEPLLRKDLEVIGKELHKREFPWGMVSNGLALTEKRLQTLLNAHLSSVTISFDGLEDSHNWLRGNNKSFASAYNAIQLLGKTKGLIYDVVTCVNQRNINQLDDVKKLLVRAGVKNWRLFTIFPVGRAAEHSELQLNPTQFKSVFEFIKNEREMGDIDVSYGCEGFLGNYEGEVRDHFFFCRSGINSAAIMVDGSVSGCTSLRENFIEGNIYRDNFSDIWENRFQQYRNREWTKTGVCTECKQFKYCDGNGLHLRNEKSGELLFCHYNRINEAY